MKQQQTAILIFANSSQEEIKRKAIEKGQSLFQQLNQQIIRTVEKTTLPYFLFTEDRQKGLSFGERFVNALQNVFDMGFDNVIMIGNDSPQLSTQLLHKSEQLLKQNKVVLGPNHDGGFYLIGLHKSQFHKAYFLNLPWQTHRISQCITSHFKATNTVVLLPTLIDIDTVADLKKLHNYYKSISVILLHYITQILSTTYRVWNHVQKHSQNLFLHNSYNKGSPLLH
ncbi:TIGR04282 family arsenosugar biosynthesis glycosyltransferase [Aquimarina rhabdastrellae]